MIHENETIKCLENMEMEETTIKLTITIQLDLGILIPLLRFESCKEE